MAYKLRTTLVGHEADVRGVTASAYPIDGIISVSRDQSCRIWAPSGKDFIQELILYGHSRYVSSVCIMQPSEKHPHGLVITGGHDNLILVYDFESAEPIFTLTGHSATVCSLDAGNYGTILSGSWDKTAKVWINGKEVMNLKGHDAAVWTVKMLPDKGLMLSGSADKMIKLWKAGKCEKTFIGHTDCVRCLAILNPNEFLSAANDCTIRKWNINGDCTFIYEGHSNYVYSIALIPGTDRFISSGEDRCVKVWKVENCEQTIAMPSQSVWCVGAMANGDIIAGSSDGFCRVFTESEEKMADSDVLEDFENSVANQAIPAAANLDLGEIKTDKLPGPEALLQPGAKQDQTKLIKNNGVVEAHQWDARSGEWKKVGEVTGAAGKEGAQRSTGKQVYEGKEYDYVFDVDIQDGVPPLKLPFNITDDPYFAAQKFLEKNEISQGYLDEVAHFIIKNTEGVTLGQSNTQYVDPFTGGGRYVAGSSGNQSNGQSGDPFTGQGRYVPNGSQGPTSNQGAQNNKGRSYFPETNCLKFTTGKHEQIIGKLREFNSQIQENQLSDEQLQVLSDSLNNLLKGATKLRDEVYGTLSDVVKSFSQWPRDKIVPVLDSLRILMLNDVFGKKLLSENHADTFINNLLTIAGGSGSASHGMLVYRILVNAFTDRYCGMVVYGKREQILECSSKLYDQPHKNLRIAITSFIVNTCIYCRKSTSSFEDSIQICTLIQRFLSMENNEAESIFRLLVALGTLISGKEDLVAFTTSLDIHVLVKKIHEQATEEKVKGCAAQLLQLF